MIITAIGNIISSYNTNSGSSNHNNNNNDNNNNNNKIQCLFPWKTIMVFFPDTKIINNIYILSC